MSELITKTAAELAELIAAGEVSAVEVASAHFEQIDAVDGDVHAFLALDRDRALAQAKQVDDDRAAGISRSALAGVPIAVKDLLSYEGLPTTAGSRMLENYRPVYNATVTQKLIDAGLVLLGKTNLDEFAMGSSTETSYFGPTHNPWDLDRIPGGSGGGSAAAIAAFEAPLAIGTDTGGSIRQPAAVTGTVGVKPTYGGVSRYGILPLASSLDQAGPCSRTVLDAALLHSVMGGYDPKDSTSINQPLPDVVAAAKLRNVEGMTIGVVKQFGGEGYAPGVEQRFAEAVALLTQAGATIVEVDCPSFDYALAAYYLILPAECSSNLARYDAMRYGLRVGDDGTHSVEDVMRLSRGAGFGDEVKRRIIIGTYALSSGYYDAYYGSAQKVRTLIQRDFARAFETCDVLISPATPVTPFKLGEKLDDPMAMYKCDLCTIPANMAGTPAGSFPIGLAPEDGLPVGLQVIAPVQADDRIYRVGGALEDLLESQWGRPFWAQAPALANTKAVF